MPGLGPRVGGAHVDVNMKMDEGSIDSVGKAVHRQLSQLNKTLVQIGERNARTYRAIGKDAVVAWRAMLGSLLAGAPHFGTAISSIAGSATMLAGSLYSLAQSGYALLPMMTSLGLAGITASIGMRNFGRAVSETNPKALAEMLKDMPKSMQNAVLSTRKLSNEMRAAVWPKLFAGLSGGIEKLRNTGVIQRGLGQMAVSMNGLVKSILAYANTKQGVSTLNTFFKNNAKVFAAMSKAVVPFLDGFLRLVNALTPAAIRLSGRITDLAKRFQGWTKEAGFGKRIDTMMKGAEKTAGLLLKTLGNLGSAIINIFNAVNPSTNTFLEMLVGVTQRFEDWTKSVSGKNSLVTWANGSTDVMRQFGKTMKSIFKVTAELADPRVIVSFLKTVQGAFDILAKLPLDKIVTAFVTISEKLQPVSSVFLAIIISGAALNILLGNMMGQMGGLFSVIAKIIKFKILVNVLRDVGGGSKMVGGAAEGAAKKAGLLSRAWQFLLRIVTRVKSAFSTVVGFFSKTEATTGAAASKVSRLGTAFKPVLSILGRFVKFAGFVGLAVWIATLIAKSDDLKKKLGKVWDSLKEVGSALADSFKEIGAALAPLAPVAKGVGKAVGPVMSIFDKIATLAIGVVLDSIVYGFKSLANVITGASHIIAGFINVLVGLFTLDFGKVWDGLKQMASGVWPLLKGLFGLFITFFAPAKLAKLGLVAFRGLGGGIMRAMPEILKVAGRLLVSVLKFLVTLTPRMMLIGARAIIGLGRAMIGRSPEVTAAAGRLVEAVIGWIARLPGRLLALGARAVGALGSAVGRGAPKVVSAAGRIATGVINWIGRLPGRLLTLGGQAVSKLAGAVSKGVSKLGGIAGRIFNAVWDAVKTLPGKMLDLGGQIVSNIGKGITDGISKVTGAIGKVAGAVGKFWPGSPVKEGPLRAWNRGSDASGGGRNVIDALTAGLRDISPIRRAMQNAAAAVSSSFSSVPALAGVGAAGGAMIQPRVAGPSGTYNHQKTVNLTIQSVKSGSELTTDVNRALARVNLFMGVG
jgi:hypothetical protein